MIEIMKDKSKKYALNQKKELKNILCKSDISFLEKVNFVSLGLLIKNDHLDIKDFEDLFESIAL